MKQGDKVALVGPSGVGKTTLINILSGELSDYSGEFTLNGQEIKDISLNSLHHLIGIVPQHSHLFRTTIAENVLLFDETLEDKLPDALNEVNLSAVVGNLQHGIDTVVGPNDEKLSGGELQRISLARALIRNKEFLVIDEGTSALDESNARDIVRRLLNKKSITLLMITHTSDRKLLSEFDQIIQLS
ncbi:MAG: ATP-binding cassette domain-containing protein [Pediococcus parvulus]